MDNWAQSFILTFVPLFIVIDAIGKSIEESDNYYRSEDNPGDFRHA